MSLRRELMVLSVALSLVVAGCSGLRLSPVTAQPTDRWIPGKFIWHDLITLLAASLGTTACQNANLYMGVSSNGGWSGPSTSNIGGITGYPF